MKTSFVWSKYWANRFVTLSCPISLAFNFKCYFLLLILIYSKIQLSLASVCPSGPCKNCSLLFWMHLATVNILAASNNDEKLVDTRTVHFARLKSSSRFEIIVSLRWLDTVFQGQYLPSLSINYVAKNKVLEKLPPQLY